MCGLTVQDLKGWRFKPLYFTSFRCRQRANACLQTSTVGHNTNKTPHVHILLFTLHYVCSLV